MSASAIASALVRWRREHPDLIPLGATFHSVTDAAANETAPTKTVLFVSVGPSDTRAVVPFTAREDVYVSEGSRLEQFIEKLESAMAVGRIGYEKVEISFPRRTGISFDDGAGLSVKATITWEGLASWR